MTANEKELVQELIRTIPDFPEPGILFRDITTLLKDKKGLQLIIKDFTDRYMDKGIDYVLGADARGFIFGAAIAYNIGAGFVPARKIGKLPAETVKVEYELEYGKGILEVHTGAFEKGAKVLIVDDLLATGGTAGSLSYEVMIGNRWIPCNYQFAAWWVGYVCEHSRKVSACLKKSKSWKSLVLLNPKRRMKKLMPHL